LKWHLVKLGPPSVLMIEHGNFLVLLLLTAVLTVVGTFRYDLVHHFVRDKGLGAIEALRAVREITEDMARKKSAQPPKKSSA
jgi:hypothetical protein